MTGNLHFLRPAWLLAILPLVWLLWRYWRGRQQGGAWQAVCDPHLLPHLLVAGAGRGSRTPLWLLAVAGVLGIVALAGPVWSRLPQPVYRNTAATVVLLNLSESMNAPDVKPTRLTRARLKLLDFLHRQREGQTALIAYAGEAYVVSPLTDDAATIASLVTALESDIMPAAGNNLEQALHKADALLDQDGVPHGGRILLITDSAGSGNVRDLVAGLARKGRVVSVLGVGTRAGAPIPASAGGFVLDRDGGILIPRLQPQQLAALAAAGHGHYARLTTTDADLNQLWPAGQATRIDSKRASRNRSADVWREEGPWLLLLVLPLLALVWRQGWLSVLVLALLLPPPPARAADWGALWSRPDQQAYRALQHGDAKRAAGLFHDPAWKSVAQYRAGNYAAAAAGFAGEHNPQALYNAANALAHLGKLQAAAENYHKVLQQQPDNQDARHNLKLVEDLLKRRQQHASPAQNKTGQGKQGKPAHKTASGSQQQPGRQGQPDGDETQASQGKQAHSKVHNNAQQAGQAQKSTTPAQTNQSQANTAKRSDSKKFQAQQTDHIQSQTAEKRPQPNHSANVVKAKDRPSASITQASEQQKESAQALQQWLRRIPDDPGGLLRRKFMYLHQQRQQAANNQGN